MRAISLRGLAISAVILSVGLAQARPEDISSGLPQTSACPSVNHATYDPVEFRIPTIKDKPCTWRKPENVKYILVKACGGGGGGQNPPFTRFFYSDAGRKPKKAGPTLTAGGRAAQIHTMLVGPLTQDEYQVTIGAGGAPGQKGTATLFAHQRENFTLTFSAGGAGGSASISTPWAQAGANPRFGNALTKGYGGDAGLGPGGNSFQHHEDVRKRSHGTAGGTCAGGGAGADYGQTKYRAGAGGPGYMLIIPILPFQNLSPAPSTVESSEVPQDR